MGSLAVTGQTIKFCSRQVAKIFAVFADWVGRDGFYTRGLLVLCGSGEEQLAPGLKLCVIL